MNATVSESKTEVITLKEAIRLSGLSDVYVRRAILLGKLQSTKVAVNNTSVLRHEIKVADFEAWRASVGTRGRRSDGRAKYNLYGTPEEIEAIQLLLNEQHMAEANLTKVPKYVKKTVAIAAE